MNGFSARFRRGLVLPVVLACALFGLPTVDAKETPIKVAKAHDVERIRVLGPNNLPVKVMVVLSHVTGNLPFVSSLAKIVAKIHEQDKLTGDDRFKLQVFPSHPDMMKQLEERITPKLMKDYVEAGGAYSASDIWMQDWGEVGMVKLRFDPKPQLLILDSNRGQELGPLPQLLARFWNAWYMKNPSKVLSGGDSGGNIEVTPDDVLVIGDRASPEFLDFLKRRGYKDRMALLETNWLVVGHVDEYLSIVPNDQAAEGFTIIKANPKLGLELLKKASRGELEKFKPLAYRNLLLAVFDELQRQDGIQPPKPEKSDPDAFVDPELPKKARQLIKQNLALTTLIDDNINKLTDTLNRVQKHGNRGYSIMSYPQLYFEYYTDKFLAITPGVINQLILRKHLIVPNPQMAVYKTNIRDVAAKLGLKIHFLDDVLYHEKWGDIHCGTNVFRHPNRYIVTPRNLPEWYRDAAKPQPANEEPPAAPRPPAASSDRIH